jgi:hypothetical protein
MILHWPDPQRAAGAAAPLRRASNLWPIRSEMNLDTILRIWFS